MERKEKGHGCVLEHNLQRASTPYSLLTPRSIDASQTKHRVFWTPTLVFGITQKGDKERRKNNEARRDSLPFFLSPQSTLNVFVIYAYENLYILAQN